MPAWDFVIPTAIGFFAGICGRGWGISGTGLNHDIIVIGQSASGKNVVHQGIANIIKQLEGTPILEFIVTSQMASAPALRKFVVDTPCCVQLIGEVGKMYRAYSTSKFGDHLDQLFTAKLDLWERSGPDGMSVGINYSDKDKNVAGGTMRIAHSTLGESTPDMFYHALTTDMMNEGIVSRLWIFEHVGDDPEDNLDRLEVLPEPLLNHLRGLVINASQRRVLAPQESVSISPEARVVFENSLMHCKERKALAPNPAARQLWGRSHEKVLRLAALCAVADNYLCPEVSFAHADWAYNTMLRTNSNLRARVGEDIADDDDHSRERMVLDRCRRWLKESNIDPQREALRQQSVITRRFLQQEVGSKKIFKNFRGGAVQAFNLTMRSLIAQGYLIEPKQGSVKVPAKSFWDGKPEEQTLTGECWKILELPPR